MFYFAHCESPVGELMLAGDERHVSGLWMEGQKYFGATLPGGAVERENLPVFCAARQWLQDYFAGKRPEPSDLPLAPAGGAFRQLVWKILLEIPYGQVAAYGWIAKEAAKRRGRASMSSQAVGGAVGHNPISILIPCHRVVGSDGSLTGYAGGLDKKRWLLKHEGVDLSRFYLPKRGSAL